MLELHMRLHFLQNPFVCNTCNFGCRDSITLRRHKLIHLDQPVTSTGLYSVHSQQKSNANNASTRSTKKPYAYCQDCGYQSTSIAEFKKHKNCTETK